MKTITRPFFTVPAFAFLFAAFAPTSARAHHFMDGGVASNAVEGFLSGMAHPVIGIDHLAMVLAIGILAASMRPGFLLAGLFVVAAMCGTGLHLLGLDLPGSEALVALSVVAVGSLLALRHSPAPGWAMGISAVAGLLHGYAYGESIFGAEATPLTAYLVGFTVIQLAIAGAAFAISRALQKKSKDTAFTLRPAGFMVAGAGMALLAAQVIALSLPTP
jgi:urease accessory protein